AGGGVAAEQGLGEPTGQGSQGPEQVQAEPERRDPGRDEEERAVERIGMPRPELRRAPAVVDGNGERHRTGGEERDLADRENAPQDDALEEIGLLTPERAVAGDPLGAAPEPLAGGGSGERRRLEAGAEQRIREPYLQPGEGARSCAEAHERRHDEGR